MKLVAQFSSGGTPVTGLAPVISGHTLDASLVISGETMSEVANGFYFYDFTGYSNTEDYVFLAYESTLDATDQYVVASNEVDSLSNQGIIKDILGLSQGNMVMSGQTYDASGRLTAASLYTYPTDLDAKLGTNPSKLWVITCDYDGVGNLIDYRSYEGTI